MTRLTPDPAFADRLIAIRRDLHRHPELGGQETRSAARVAEVVRGLGIACRAGVGGTGVVADLPGPAGVPAVALRADMDALPVTEETGLDFASEVDGVMHACGHDGHVAMLLGAAELLAADRDRPAPVRLLFQPAEELGTGAAALVAAGALQGVGAIFGGHIDRAYPVGTIAVPEGAVNASTDSFRITVTGRGGHAARPHECTDALVAASFIVTALQTIVAREVNPAHPAVVTVGRFQAGSAPNVIAERADVEGTLRAQDPAVRARLKESVRRVAESVGRLHGAAVTVELSEGTPAVVNDPLCVAVARDAAESIGAALVRALDAPNMGGEDFGFYLEHVPGCFARLGARPEGRESFPAHSSRFDFDEHVLPVGAAYFHAVAHAAGRRLASARAIA